jgi:putative acetyltransferase
VSGVDESADVTVALEDPRSADVVALLTRHLAFARSESPPEDAHALEVDGLAGSDVSFFTLRRDGALLAVGALRRLDESHAEIKSMHTAAAHRGQGLAAHVLEHLLAHARTQGFSRVSLETGSMESFAPARALYRRAGFVDCAPFGDYRPSDWSTFLTRTL